jgi:hypothetical protein
MSTSRSRTTPMSFVCERQDAAVAVVRDLLDTVRCVSELVLHSAPPALLAP